MTRRCPTCGKNLRAHLDGSACNILQTATRAPPSRTPRARGHR